MVYGWFTRSSIKKSQGLFFFACRIALMQGRAIRQRNEAQISVSPMGGRLRGIVKQNFDDLRLSQGTQRKSSSHYRGFGPLRVAAPDASSYASLTSQDGDPVITFSNDVDEQCTLVTICGRSDTATLIQLTSVFNSSEIIVASANFNSPEIDGDVCNVFRVTDNNGNKLAEDKWSGLQAQLLFVLSGSSRSSKPAIFGAVAVEESSPTSVISTEGDVSALETAAAEMAQAANALVGLERDIISLASSMVDPAMLSVKQVERAEASSLLERKMAAMEAILTSRRTVIEQAKAVEPALPSFLQPPPLVTTTGPGAGSGYEIILQGFNWESNKEQWYKKLITMTPEIAKAGFTAVWLPPASDSVSAEGYLPRDLYDLNSKYGTEAELRQLVSVLHEHGLKAIADIVVNHRCAHYQGSDGKWNKFGGRLAWDNSYLCSNNPSFGGSGGRKKQEDYPAAPNLDHGQERLRKDIIEWMRYLRNSIGYDGWRFDFVKGYDGKWTGEYVNATVPLMAFGEYWDTCSYADGVLSYNQDAHRQRTVDWCDATGGTCAAFDFTLKGILQEAVSKKEYWRLVDSQGRPSGVLGLWPSRAVTFLENHDTGSTLQHWPFPWQHAAEGYAYLLTHPGTPCIFFDHFYYDEGHRSHILKLIEIRKKYSINYKSEVSVKKAYNDLYAAVVDKRIAMKIGPAHWAPEQEDGVKEWKLTHSGPNFAVWEGIR